MGGAPTHPAWYHNIKANPQVGVEIGDDESYTANAEILTEGPERAAPLRPAGRPHAELQGVPGEDRPGDPGGRPHPGLMPPVRASPSHERRARPGRAPPARAERPRGRRPRRHRPLRGGAPRHRPGDGRAVGDGPHAHAGSRRRSSARSTTTSSLVRMMAMRRTIFTCAVEDAALLQRSSARRRRRQRAQEAPRRCSSRTRHRRPGRVAGDGRGQDAGRRRGGRRGGGHRPHQGRARAGHPGHDRAGHQARRHHRPVVAGAQPDGHGGAARARPAQGPVDEQPAPLGLARGSARRARWRRSRSRRRGSSSSAGGSIASVPARSPT